MTTTLIEITDNPHTQGDDDIEFFADLEASTTEAQTGCGDDNPYR